MDEAVSITALDMQAGNATTVDTGGYAFITSGDFTITAGTFSANASTITVSGNWSSWVSGQNNGFDRGTSTVVFNGATQSIYCRNFNNLTINTGSTVTITRSILIHGTLTINGTGILTDGAGSYTVKIFGSLANQPTSTSVTVNLFTYTNDSSVKGGDYSGCSQLWFFTATDNYTFTLGGNITAPDITVRDDFGNYQATLDTAGYSLTATGLTLGLAKVIANGSTVDINGNVTLTYVNWDEIDAGSSTWTVSGNWDNSVSATFTAGSSTVTFDGSGAQSITSGGDSFNAITVTNSSAGGVTFADALTTNTLSNTTNGSTLKFATSGTHTISNTLTLTGGTDSNIITLEPATASTNWNLSPPAGTTVTGVDVSYSQSDKTITANNSNNGGNNNANWVFGGVTRYWAAGGAGNWNDTANWSDTSGGSGGFSVPGNGDTAVFDANGTGDCTLDIAPTVSTLTASGYGGTISTGTNDLTTATMTLSSGALTSGNQTTTVSGTLTVSGGTLSAGSGNIDAGNVTITSGTLTTPGSGNTFTLSGDLIHSGGAFAANNGTVTLDGGNQSISGSTTFYNLTKTVTSPATLTFDNTATLTITNTLTLNGVSGQLLLLRSDSAGNQWEIDPRGTRNVSYVDVQDSNNINTSWISTANSVSSGNNTRWYFNVLTMDIDNDGTNEEARDSDGNSANGYEVYFDPGGSITSTAVLSTDSDSDGKIDHFIDTNGDTVPEKYWDPDKGILKDITLINVNGDGTGEWVYDSDDNGTYDRAYNPSGSKFIDPFGVVFDSVTNNEIAGAVVTFYNKATNLPAVPGVELSPGDSNPVTTDATGIYGFNAAPGDYYIRISTDGYSYPSVKNSFPAERTICPSGLPLPESCDGQSGSKGETFTVAAAVITMDHPMDVNVNLIKVTKKANKKEANIGDIITYAITIESKTTTDLTNVYITDRIPAGFKYIRERAILDNQKTDDPEGQRPITFNIGILKAWQTMTLKYQLIVGSGVTFSKYENSVWARYSDGTVISNVAREEVMIIPDPLFDLGTVIGKVFWDRNDNGVQDSSEFNSEEQSTVNEESGIAEVRIVTEEGTIITTDKDGKYHLAGITPGRHIFRINEMTLPEGTYLTTDKAVIIDITPGMLQKANFGVNKTGFGVQSSEFGVQNTEHRTQSTEHRAQTTNSRQL